MTSQRGRYYHVQHKLFMDSMRRRVHQTRDIILSQRIWLVKSKIIIKNLILFVNAENTLHFNQVNQVL